ncbi:hypothetical protein CPB85DRAFT_748918 [Mucidula mucida]|nr:hypothetical protein CPB85DRAFT_748918 [Mucidula mucida]
MPTLKRIKRDHSDRGDQSTRDGSPKLLDLPNEILMLIFSDITERDIISVGSLCRRFNQVAFNHHFFRPSHPEPAPDSFIHDPSTFYVGRYRSTPTFSPWTFLTFQAIRLALFAKPKIHVLNTRFSLSSFPAEVKQITKYFDTKPTLHSVSIELPYGPGPAGLGFQWRNKRDNLLPEELRNNRLALYDLLRSLTLIVADSVYMGDELMMDFGQGIPIDDNAEYLPPYDGPLLTTPTFVTFSYCCYLFLPPILNWTINSLNASRIRRLVLEDVDIGPHLCELQLDSLQDVVVRSRSITQMQLNDFLCRHTSLIALIIFRISSEESPDANIAIHEDALPKVEEVTAPSSFFSTWLSVPGTLAGLRDVRLEGRPSTDSLQFILSHLPPTVSTLHLPLCYLSETDEWLSLPAAERAETHLTGIRRLDMGLPIGWHMTQQRMSRIVDSVARFPNVRSLSVWPATDRATWATEFLAMLKDRCPGVKETVFDFERLMCDHSTDVADETI